MGLCIFGVRIRDRNACHKLYASEILKAGKAPGVAGCEEEQEMIGNHELLRLFVRDSFETGEWTDRSILFLLVYADASPQAERYV